MVPLRGEDHAVILPWSPPPTPCAEASVTSFEAADTKASSKGEGVVAAVVIDGWMVLTRVDTGEIIDQRFGELYRDVNSVLVAGNEACGAAWGQVDVSYVHYGNVPVLRRSSASGGGGADASAGGQGEAGIQEGATLAGSCMTV